SFQQIQKYENGANRVGASRLTQIAGALGVPLATLFDGSPKAGRAGPDLYGRELLANAHALRLLQAFDKILNRKSRMAVVHLIESIGNGHARRGSNGRSRRQVH